MEKEYDKWDVEQAKFQGFVKASLEGIAGEQRLQRRAIGEVTAQAHVNKNSIASLKVKTSALWRVFMGVVLAILVAVVSYTVTSMVKGRNHHGNRVPTTAERRPDIE